MRGKDLFEKLTDIDDRLIENKTTRTQFSISKFALMSACLALVIVGSISFIKPDSTTEFDPNLPRLTLDTDFYSAMGFEGYQAYDITSLVNANPWDENTDIEYLPVIKNKVTYNDYHAVQNPDYELMEELLRDTARSLGMDENSAITNDVPDEETKQLIIDKFGGTVPDGYFDIQYMYLEDTNYKLKIDTGLTITLEFKTPVKLPDSYNFTHYATYDENNAVAEYLQNEYADFINFDDAIINIDGGDFNYFAEQMYNIYFYKNSNDTVNSVLNYNFNNVEFYGDDNGDLFLARKYYTDLTDVVGEYPIASVEQATDLLENGNYITTVPQEFEGAEYIRKVELVYKNSSREKIFMPYYRFYVELPEFKHEDTGLNTYGAYYVPAIEGKYIENMPQWNGEFNY